MKDRILQSYLTDFIEEYDLKDLEQDEAFERFANYNVIAREHSDDFDLEQISVGGNHDVAIDGLGILVNEHLISSKEDVDFFKQTLRRLDVNFIFIQSKTTDKFDSGDIGNFLFGVKSFFQKNPLIKENIAIQRLRDLKEYIYDSSIDMDASPTCHMYYVTTGKWTEDENLMGKIYLGVEELKQFGLFSDVHFFPIDAEKLRNIYRELKLKVIKEIAFDKHTILPLMIDVQESYIGILPCTEYLKLITDSEGNLLRSLFYDNVRDFQGNNPVNREIQETLKSTSQNDKFALLNNGITIVAKSINKVGTSFKLKDYQIVNGCQTSHVLFRNKESITNKVFLPIKLIVTNSPDVINQVIKATNRQTEVTLEAFEALNPFQKKLEEFYGSFGKDQHPKLHYERRSKQYDTLPINKQQIVSLTAQIKSFVAMFLNEPHSTHRYYGELLRANRNRIFIENHSLFPYYLSGYALCCVERLFTEQKIPRFYRQFKYQMLLLFRIISEPFKLPYLNANKIDEYCTRLLSILSDEYSALRIFKTSSELINTTLKETKTFPLEATRLRAFTNEIVERALSSTKSQKSSLAATVEREIGEVTWYSDIRGFGFIKGALHENVFAHCSEIISERPKSLQKGQRVDFIAVDTERGVQARDINIL